jgi:hypothetical protein
MEDNNQLHTPTSPPPPPLIGESVAVPIGQEARWAQSSSERYEQQRILLYLSRIDRWFFSNPTHSLNSISTEIYDLVRQSAVYRPYICNTVGWQFLVENNIFISLFCSLCKFSMMRRKATYDTIFLYRSLKRANTHTVLLLGPVEVKAKHFLCLIN